MSSDAPIVDEFDEDNTPRRRSTWGFSNVKRSIVKSHLISDGMIPDNSNNKALAKGDIKAKRKSWKDLANIRDYLKGIDESLQDVVETEQKAKLNPSGIGSGSQERRKWFVKLRFQQQLISRLTGIEKNIKGKGKGGLGLFGLLGSMGALGTLLKIAKDKGLAGILGGSKGGSGIASGLGKQIVQGLLTAMFAKSAIGFGLKGAGGLLKLLGSKAGGFIAKGGKTFGQKSMGMLGGMLKAGKARLLTGALPSMGLGGLAGALGGVGTAEGGSALTAVMRAVLPKILGRIGMAVFGIPGAVAMTAKLIWDHLLPDSWKRYITYKVSKFYLAAIDKVASMFEWVANTFDSIKNKVAEFYNGALARIYAAMDFVGDLITGEGDARQRVKNYLSNIWRTLELTISTYVGGFVTVFKNAYTSFVKPFYDEKGNFSLARGIKYYAKAGYDFGANAINNAGAAIDQAVSSAKKAIGELIDSNYNPANWQKNAEDYVKRYEQEEAIKAKNAPKDETNQLIAKTQDATQNTLDTLDKTLKSTNKYLQVAANAATGLAGSFMNGFNSGMSGGSQVYTTDGSGGGLGGLVAKAESGGNYNAFNRGNAGDSKQGQYDFTKMTIGQIMQLQAQGKVFAVGKYQMIPDTLTDAVNKLNLGRNTLFTPEIQEYMFQNYLVSSKRAAVKGFITGQTNNLQEAQMDLAREFASIGVPYSGREGKRSFTKGGTYYVGKGGNKASVSDTQSAQALQESRAIYAKAKQDGKSDQEAWNEVFKANSGAGLSASDIQSANAGVTSGPSSTIGSDPMAAIMAAMQDPEKARQAYEQAKLEYTGHTVQLDRPADLTNARVSSIGSQINQDVRYPNDIGAAKRAELKAQQEEATVANTINPSKANTPTSGSSQNALFGRMNMANVNHENAFPV